MQTLTIRPATLEDVPQLQDLISLSARSLNLQHYTAAQVESALTWVFGVDTQLIEDGTYYAALDGERIIGCGGWSRRSKNFGGDQTDLGQNVWLDPQTEAAKIRAFFIHPEYARLGIGRKLLEQCENAAQADGFQKLEMVATLTGHELYAKCGYISESPLDIQIPNGETFSCIKMTKQF